MPIFGLQLLAESLALVVSKSEPNLLPLAVIKPYDLTQDHGISFIWD
jgi:hypothetical protein